MEFQKKRKDQKGSESRPVDLTFISSEDKREKIRQLIDPVYSPELKGIEKKATNFFMNFIWWLFSDHVDSKLKEKSENECKLWPTLKLQRKVIFVRLLMIYR